MDLISYALSKRYIDKTVEGLGSIKGQPCTIRSVTEKDNGTEIVFEWTGANGASETSTIFVKNGVDGKDGDDGISISKVEKINTVDLVDTYRITFSDNTFFDYSVTNGVQGVQGIKGEKGDQGEQGVQGVQGIKGDKGDDGYPFLIYKEYSDISEFNENDFPEIGLMFMVKSDSTSSYPVYRYTGDTTTPYSHVTNLEAGQGIKGDKGDKGDTGEQGVAGENGKDGITYTPVIGTVVSGTTASASVTINDDTYTATFDFVIPKGDKGDAGECIVDDALSDTSENPVQNKVVKQAIDSKADKTVATTSADGLMSAEDKGKLDGADNTYALKSKYGDTTINIGRMVNAPIGEYSTSLGIGTVANGYASTAEGAGSQAAGYASHAGGYNCQAIKEGSFAHGYGVYANHDYETAFGKHNVSNDDTLFSIGDGIEINTDGNISIARHNAFEITATGGKLHDKDILTSAHCIQFIPHNMKYYALNDRILLFSNDDAVTRGIYFINDTPNDIVVCALISATGSGPVVQYGYGSNTYPNIQNTGEGREWFSEESINTFPTIYTMTVPSGKHGYYGVYHNSETAYTTVHDIRCPHFNFF